MSDASMPAGAPAGYHMRPAVTAPSHPDDARRVVLVVEDDPKMAALIQRALGHVAIDSCVATTGDEALRHLRESPDMSAVVLDVMIPHPDGIEVCRQARRDGHRGPIIVISARGSEPDRVRALDAGADLFLSKPFPLAELARTIAGLVDAPDGT